MLLTSILIAISLSMDAFSLAILYGTSGINKNSIRKLSLIVGIYHFFMPIIGFYIGKLILDIIPMKTDILVGSIFLILSLQMFFSSFKEEDITPLANISSYLLFGFTVSIDSLTVGIGLGTISSKILIPPIIFSITSFLFTFIGLRLGRILNSIFGKISTIIGSIILFILSILYLL